MRYLVKKNRLQIFFNKNGKYFKLINLVRKKSEIYFKETRINIGFHV